jgi:cytochrome c oxidase accessory protein FixG
MNNNNPDTPVEDFDLYRDESFRDSIGTIGEDGKRKILYPKKTKGRYMKWRSLVAYGLLVFLFIAPWLKIDGQPFLMFNVLERRFVIFGNVFWPQDFHLLVLAMISGVVFVILFTVVYGRVFCGWICPQTIFMEHVFRKIEYWIDGDRGQQIKLAKMPWNAEKIRKRLLKNGIFFLIAFAISNTFLMYLTGNDAWLEIVTDDTKDHVAGLAGMVVFTGIFFFVFASFREQVCLIVCPYGRLQGAMLDKNSIVIAYDYIRGEKRARFKKNENRADAKKGACVDCHQCVDVCPTGIDIRNGTQLECINCAACIDVCDSIMEKTGQDKGLIRYASEKQIREKIPFTFSSRIIAYTSVLVVLLGVMGFLLSSREQIEATILRQPGLLYQDREDGEISNLYDFKVINKSTETMDVDIRLLEPEDGRIEWVGQPDLQIDVQKLAQGKFFIYLNQDKLSSSNTEVKLGIYVNGELESTSTSNFNGPRK